MKEPPVPSSHPINLRSHILQTLSQHGESSRTSRELPLPLRLLLGCDRWLANFGMSLSATCSRRIELRRQDFRESMLTLQRVGEAPYLVLRLRVACEHMSVSISAESVRGLLEAKGLIPPSRNLDLSALEEPFREFVLETISNAAILGHQAVFLHSTEVCAEGAKLPHLVTVERQIEARVLHAFGIEMGIDGARSIALCAFSPGLLKHWQRLSSHFAHSGNLGRRTLSDWGLALQWNVSALNPRAQFKVGQKLTVWSATEEHIPSGQSAKRLDAQLELRQLSAKAKDDSVILSLECQELSPASDSELQLRLTVMNYNRKNGGTQ